MASKILGMFWMDIKVSSFWRYNPICVQTSDGLLGRAFSLEIFLGGNLKETHFPSPPEFENWDTEIGQAGGKQAARVARGRGLSMLRVSTACSPGPQHPRTPRPCHAGRARAPEARSWGPGQHVCAPQAGRCRRVKESCPSELIPLPREASGRAEQSGACRSSELGLYWEPGGKEKQASSPNIFCRLSHFLKGTNVRGFP